MVIKSPVNNDQATCRTLSLTPYLPVPSKLPMARDGPSVVHAVCILSFSTWIHILKMTSAWELSNDSRSDYVVSLGGVVSSFVRCQVCAQEFHRFAQQVGRLGEKDSWNRFRYLLSHLIFLKYAILSILFQVQHCSTNTVEICRVSCAIRIDKFRQAAKAVDRKVAQGPDLSKAPRSMVNSGWVKAGQSRSKLWKTSKF